MKKFRRKPQKSGFWIPEVFLKNLMLIDFKTAYLFLWFGSKSSLTEYPTIQEIAERLGEDESKVWDRVEELFNLGPEVFSLADVKALTRVYERSKYER